MPRRKRKTRYYRGSRYCGWGQVGQHRKSGSRGGFGMTGLKKHKKYYMLKYAPDHFGKHGFKSIYPPKRTINVGDLSKFVEKGIHEINLDQLGYDKLLGDGRISVPVRVVVKEASKKAIEKIKECGGEVILLRPR